MSRLGIMELPRDSEPARVSHRLFYGVAAVVFAASTAVTIVWCGSMSAMGGMAMPGGWTMPMTWMRMPGQSWPEVTATFLGMWVVMMVAMMLPSLVPPLRGHRLGLAAVVGAGYFWVWTLFGVAIFPVGIAIATLEMRQPSLAQAVPFLAGLVVVIAGVLQLTTWKARHLACCREAVCLPSASARHMAARHGHTVPGFAGSQTARAAWRYGVRLGLHCGQCCAGLMVVLLILGVMDLRAMAIVAAAITAERVFPAGERVARFIGVLMVGTGMFLIGRAAGL